jgi:hypothetical protein
LIGKQKSDYCTALAVGALPGEEPPKVLVVSVTYFCQLT